LTEIRPFAERLLAWWQHHGRHDLPWQQPRSLYRVWVSEIMLQQTQVATVIPYVERWMTRFPDLATLAGADQDEVLALWSGLGYYARARNLRQAAQRCMDQHGGGLPTDPQQLAALPGIGLSTANAILSQVLDTPLPILDGNVRRVLARHAAIPGWPGQAAVQKALWAEAEKRLPAERGADYSQAVMDLGASLCSARKPDCKACPVQADCRAHLAGTVADFPATKPARAPRELHLCMLLWQRGDAVLLERRPPAGIWGGLWCPPQAETAQELAQRFGLDPASLSALPQISHRLTHRLLHITPLWTQSVGHARGVESDSALAWQPGSAWPQLGLPRPVADMLERLDATRRQGTHCQ
jgi:A/G-specific adenine glycosylase